MLHYNRYPPRMITFRGRFFLWLLFAVALNKRRDPFLDSERRLMSFLLVVESAEICEVS